MSNSLANTVTAEINEKGNVTGKEFSGIFIAKTKLSIAGTLEEDRIRRTVLGENSQDAGGIAQGIAAAYAYLRVRLVNFPDWWKDSDLGLSLEDLNILAAVNNSVQELIGKEYEKLNKAAIAAQETLKAEAAKGQ